MMNKFLSNLIDGKHLIRCDLILIIYIHLGEKSNPNIAAKGYLGDLNTKLSGN